MRDTGDFIYIRLHGPGGANQGCHSDQTLAIWAERLLQWRAKGIAVYCYFDNDEQGYAPLNALQLDRFVREPEAGPRPQEASFRRNP